MSTSKYWHLSTTFCWNEHKKAQAIGCSGVPKGTQAKTQNGEKTITYCSLDHLYSMWFDLIIQS